MPKLVQDEMLCPAKDSAEGEGGKTKLILLMLHGCDE